ncbi:abscission/NoCut checkpoint regulator isoform X2 [Aplysia californica]|uniref:Abscission/NoCut checkpoint regulator isoform X2 n=1 Tax=Aplysia californica TaxID=6500 RepID=A0ABM1A8T9_APLCA|nr:abscission/NoCut checkpoint regulator isoform X2 [Aplysia californica]XP_012943037.1 abscission/NoCut checkpoint regulator isoform X2 [Aplysia californica]
MAAAQSLEFSRKSKCLAEKSIAIPKRNNSKHHVCVKCYNILSGQAEPNQAQVPYELPEAYLKRVAALKEKEVSHPSHSGGQKVPSHLRSLDPPDRQIAMRLEKLKDKDKPKEKVTDKGLNARLAQLKGQTYTPDAKPVYRPPDRRLQPQQVDDLLEEIAAEVEIDSHRPNPAQEVEARLAQFRSECGASKPAADANSQSEGGKSGDLGSNLNKANVSDATASKSFYNKNVGNITGPSASGEEMDMDEMQRLMEQAAREMELDAQKALQGMEKDKELMDKLREIQKKKDEKKNADPGSNGSEVDNTAQAASLAAAAVTEDDDSDDEEDEDAAAKKIIQRYFEEVKIDESVGDDIPAKGSKSSGKQGAAKKNKKSATPANDDLKPSNIKPPTKEELVDSDYDDSDELPYCCICNEDAVTRCKDCDLDLYCQRCFRDCHAEFGRTDHRTSAYKAPKGYS